jgi:cold shock CspA family protein
MGETFAKKELQKKRAKKKQDKLEKKEERKNNNNKGKSFEDMIVYLDENGNLTDVHPDKQIKGKPIEPRSNQNSKDNVEAIEFTGTISSFFKDKNFGFIVEDITNANIFIHGNSVQESINIRDRVSYKKEKTAKGYAAFAVKKI